MPEAGSWKRFAGNVLKLAVMDALVEMCILNSICKCQLIDWAGYLLWSI